MNDNQPTITVEVPVVLRVTLNDVMEPNEKRPVRGVADRALEWVENPDPTPEFTKAVKRAVETEHASVKEVYGAVSYSISATDPTVGQ